ncbi:flagellar motor protein MotB [Paludibacterium paludis]|uniref:Chemotaxis protein LafU n=1 Tax=Paludibacterium paludis TaxID=1225769 RepID=A0A918U6W9_9NEIS|nr:flagellar motor protein MotB [Paludibacterium paludis]GGY04676.1 chemotaxis protein LafU [Paludibacterium paludis]
MALKKEHEEAVIKRVSRKHDEEGHGGAWKVAFADFCLALMCLFLVLWVLAARNQEQAETLLRTSFGNPALEGGSSVLNHEGNPPGSLIPRDPVSGRIQAQAQSQIKNSGMNSAIQKNGAETSEERKYYDSAEDLKKLAKTLKEMSAEAGLGGNIDSNITPYGLRVMLHDTDNQGMFDRGSALPSPRFRLLLHKIGPLFAAIENQVMVVGHTDSVQYAAKGASAFSNWTLSSNRAMAARANLIDGGMPAANVLQVVGMADRAPYDPAHPDASINRRIELLVLSRSQAAFVAGLFGMPGANPPPIRTLEVKPSDGGSMESLRTELPKAGQPPAPKR